MRLCKVCHRIAVQKPRHICEPCHRAIKGPPRQTNRLVNRGWDASDRLEVYERMGWKKGMPQADDRLEVYEQMGWKKGMPQAD